MKKYTFAALGERVRYFGRLLPAQNDGMQFSFSYSGFSIRFTGEEFALFADTYTPEMPAYFTVNIDGLTEKIAVRGEETSYIFRLKAGEHTVTVRRASAWGDSRPVTFSAVGLDDDADILEPPAEKPFKMEFIGDSITCGYGILGVLGELYQSKTEDATLNYAAQVAAAFDADARFIAYSGQGIVYNCAGEIGLPIPQLFRSAQRHTTDIPWNFDDGFVPHVVVVNAGTNDEGGKTTDEQMYAGATAFLKDIRAQYPNAKIVWTYGMMNTKFVPILTKVAEDMRVTDQNVWFLPIQPVGCFAGETATQGHPAIRGHRRAAKELIAFIKGIL